MIAALLTLIGLVAFASFIVVCALVAAWLDSLEDGGDR